MNIEARAKENRIDILAVEDSPTQAERLRYILEEDDYHVTLARNGVEAMAVLNGYKPAAVISDIVMPEMDGFELCRRLKAYDDTRHVPVVLLTSLSSVQDVVQALECGADSFITKPYSPSYLLSRVRRALTDRESRTSPGACSEMEIPYADKRLPIKADPQRVFSLLLSTYEAAIHRNAELLQTENELSLLNERLEELVQQRTEALSAEIAERERLQQELVSLSLHDDLTHLSNRRGFATVAEQHRHLAIRTRQEFVLLYMDLDDFKQINDRFGHAQGDQALQGFAGAMRQTFRESDILARMGGDEFVVLLPDCDMASASAAADHLRANLRQLNEDESRAYTLSTSIGFAHFEPGERASLDDLIKLADGEMYAQKQLGKAKAVCRR